MGFFSKIGKAFKKAGSKIKSTANATAKSITQIAPKVYKEVKGGVTTLYKDAKQVVNKNQEIFGNAVDSVGGALKSPFLWIAGGAVALLALRR